MSDPTLPAAVPRTGLVIDLDPELPAIVDVHAELAPELRARGIPFHLTVLYPFAPPDEVDALLPPLEQVLARHGPFALELAGVGEWPGVVYADPEPSEPLRALMHDVWGALPAFPPYQGEHDDPHPHATIAVPDAASQAAVAARAREALRESLPAQVTVAALLLLEEHEPGYWRPRRRLALGRAS